MKKDLISQGSQIDRIYVHILNYMYSGLKKEENQKQFYHKNAVKRKKCLIVLAE